MKQAPEQYRLKNHPQLGSTAAYGNNGFFVIPHYKITGYELRCQISDGGGWEHVSVTIGPIGKTATRCPTWEEMCFIKSVFWNDNEVVIQYHPAKDDYVSMHHFCLHLWRPTNIQLPTPDPLMVGINLKLSK